MSLYVIGDTHFSSDRSYSMEVFGGAWKDYTLKLTDSFSKLLPDDTLLICGDFSWGMDLSDTLPDLLLLNGFKGKKILLKGNHDYWWETLKKMKAFLKSNSIDTIDFLHNNFFEYQEYLLCGTRGWVYDKNNTEAQNRKIFNREVIRLSCSLKSAREYSSKKEILAFLHYPPVYENNEADEFTSLLKSFNVKRCFYGHLHAESIAHAFEGIKDGIEYKLVSADAVDFKPFMIIK
jgi:predicted phosphohydrolase